MNIVLSITIVKAAKIEGYRVYRTNIKGADILLSLGAELVRSFPANDIVDVFIPPYSKADELVN